MPLAYSTGLSLPLFTAVEIQGNQVTLAVYESADDHEKRASPGDAASIPVVLPEFSIGNRVCCHPDRDDVLYLVDTLSIDIDRIAETVNPRTLGPCTSLYLAFDAVQRKLLPPYNKMAESFQTKDHGSHHIDKIQRNVIAQILMPFTDRRGDDFAVRFSVNDDLGFWSSEDAELIKNDQQAYLDFSMRFFPKLQVEEQSLHLGRDQREQISVQLIGPDGIALARSDVGIYAKCDAGYLAKREAVTDINGRVRFSYAAMGLDEGDQATVEFGFKWYSNVARCPVQVSA